MAFSFVLFHRDRLTNFCYLFRQRFSLHICSNSPSCHNVLILLSLSNVTNLSLFAGVCQTSLSLSSFLHRCLLLSFSLPRSLSLSFTSSLSLSLCLMPLPPPPPLSFCTLIAGRSSGCYGCRAFTWGASKNCLHVRAASTFAYGRKQILACTSRSHRVVHTCVCVCVCVCMCMCVCVCV